MRFSPEITEIYDFRVGQSSSETLTKWGAENSHSIFIFGNCRKKYFHWLDWLNFHEYFILGPSLKMSLFAVLLPIYFRMGR